LLVMNLFCWLLKGVRHHAAFSLCNGTIGQAQLEPHTRTTSNLCRCFSDCYRYFIWDELWLRSQSGPRLWTEVLYVYCRLGIRSVQVRKYNYVNLYTLLDSHETKIILKKLSPPFWQYQRNTSLSELYSCFLRDVESLFKISSDKLAKFN